MRGWGQWLSRVTRLGKFSPTFFGEKIGVFLNYQYYDQLFSKFSFVSSQKRQFFAENWENRRKL
jgi:hypothetical protein